MVNAELVTLNRFQSDYFKKYQELFVEEYGFFFAENRAEQLKNILLSYLKKSPYLTFDDFYDYLSSTIPGKLLFRQIIDTITIGETYFFRNEPQLEMLQKFVLPELIKYKRTLGVNQIKIWSAGCSTGEEVYSLAMLLSEVLGGLPYWDVQLLGTDLNRNAVKIAENGLYAGTRPRRHLPSAHIRKYFLENENGALQVKNDIRKWTKFAVHNLIKDPFSMPQMIDPDIIFCRNVTIYFNTETTKELIQKFYDTLHDKGYLFLGHSETLWQLSDKFVTLDFPKGFVYQKDLLGAKKKKGPEFVPASIPEFNLESIKTPERVQEKKEEKWFTFRKEKTPFPTEFDLSFSNDDSSKLEKLMLLDTKYHEGTKCFETKDFDGALKCFDEILEQEPEYLMAHFAKATIYSNQGKYEKAMQSVNLLIKTDNLFVEAYFLKSVLHIKLRQINEAIGVLQKVIYINPDQALAYFHLANLYKELHDLAKCRLAWMNVKRICGRHLRTQIVPLSDNLTFETLETLADRALEGWNKGG